MQLLNVSHFSSLFPYLPPVLQQAFETPALSFGNISRILRKAIRYVRISLTGHFGEAL